MAKEKAPSIEFVNHKPEPVSETYLAGDSGDAAEEAQAHEEKQLEQQLDRESSASERLAIEKLLQRLDEQSATIKALEAKVGLLTVPKSMAEDREKMIADQIKEQIRGRTHVKVQLHTHENPNHNWDVPVSVNGERWVLQRGIPQEVPVSVVEVLQHAIVEGHQRIVDDEGNVSSMYVHQLRYPFTIY